MITPFSGLSLIIHLTVIVFAKIILLFRTNVPGVVIRAQRIERTTARRRTYTAFSFLVLCIVSTLMLTSFTIALHTGFTAGSVQWHLGPVVKNLAHIQWYSNPLIVGCLIVIIWLIDIKLMIRLRRKHSPEENVDNRYIPNMGMTTQ